MLSKPVQALVHTYRAYLEQMMPASERSDVIHVDEVAFRIARFYEKVRNIIDYQEEHLLRKRVIFRSLQRRIVFGDADANAAESLIKEIIRTGHLPNNAIPESKIGEVQTIIENLRYLLEAIKKLPASERGELSSWLMRVAASSIEERLDPPVRDMLLADTMYHVLRSRLVVRGGEIAEADIDAQLFIGVQRALLRVDEDQLSYRFLKFAYPEWDVLSTDQLSSVAEQLPELKRNIDAQLKHPLSSSFFALCNHYNTAFYLIQDAVLGNEDIVYNLEEVADRHPELISRSVKAAYDKRYAKQKKKLGRLAFFSVMSLFISKVIVAFAVEVPVDIWLGDFSLMHTMVNIVFPPFLMFLIIVFIRMPSKKNRALVADEVEAVVYGKEDKEYVVTLPKKKGPFSQGLLTLIYVAVSLAVIYAMSRLLLSLNFSIAGTAVFIFFVSLVAATGAKVHNRSKEISMEKESSGFLRFIFDLCTMPFVTVGKIIIGGLSKFHFLVILVNFIDLPFQLFVNFIESLSSFLRTKKEEMY